MDPKDMNTLNDDGKAFNGNFTAVAIAAGFALLSLSIYFFAI